MAGTFFLISGPSGAGKNSIISEVVKGVDGIKFAPSLTTRALRQGESEGSPYHFVSVPEFKSRIESGDILEFVEVHGNLYGTSASIIGGLLDRGFDVITDIEVIGAQAIRLKMPERTCSIFVTLDSDEELVRRIIGRQPESAEVVNLRLSRARLEKRLVSGFDYLINNIDLSESVNLLKSIIKAHKSRVAIFENSGPDPLRYLHRTCQFELDESFLSEWKMCIPQILRTYESAQETPEATLRRLLITRNLMAGRCDVDIPEFALRRIPDFFEENETDSVVETCAAYAVSSRPWPSPPQPVSS